MWTVLAALSALIWLYLLAARGGFWLASERDEARLAAPRQWPAIAVVIPARDEARSIGKSVRSLIQQDYRGPLTVTVVDDDSSDGTAAAATKAAEEAGAKTQFAVIHGRTLPSGWSGKLWAVNQGVAAAETQTPQPDYLLLTDADIVHAPDTLAWLASKAEADGLVLASLMAKLRCVSPAERIHVPAFVFFFQMLFPFAWVNRFENRIAAAAGGCMLVRADALRNCGGIESVHGALIDDCALADRLKTVGPIWLGLTDRVESVRAYDFSEVRGMISRTAYAQLRYSPLMLFGTVAAMTLIFLAPPLFALFASGTPQLLGAAAWAAMALAFQPILRFYRLSPLWGAALPAIALLYVLYTLDSAFQHGRKRGGMWKGRVQAHPASTQ